MLILRDRTTYITHTDVYTKNKTDLLLHSQLHVIIIVILILIMSRSPAEV